MNVQIPMSKEACIAFECFAGDLHLA